MTNCIYKSNISIYNSSPLQPNIYKWFKFKQTTPNLISRVIHVFGLFIYFIAIVYSWDEQYQVRLLLITDRRGNQLVINCHDRVGR